MQILAVVVRYKTPLEASETLLGLCKALAEEPELAAAYKLLIWDNSPEQLLNPHLPVPFTYRYSSRNLGVSGAYNDAQQVAIELGLPWMLLLDQDTKISRDMLMVMLRHGIDLLSRKEIAAIAPTVCVGDVVVSPRQQLYLRNRNYPAGECGTAQGEAIAINSGCMMRIEALRSIGGFSSDFWLDYSDLYVFHRFFQAGLKVWRAADATIEHNMSIMDYDRLMTPWRYENFSRAETAFHDLYRGPFENSIHTLRLFARAIKQRFKYENPEFSRIAWREWLFRMTTFKRQRILKWLAAGSSRRESF